LGILLLIVVYKLYLKTFFGLKNIILNFLSVYLLLLL